MNNNMEINLVICDDDGWQRKVLEMQIEMFSSVTFNVVGTAASADELLKLVTQPDLNIHALILDLNLGAGKDGLDIYAKIKNKGIDLPAILVTGNDPLADETYDLGLIDVVKKPYELERFNRALSKLYTNIHYRIFHSNGGKLIPVQNNEAILNLTPNNILYIDTEPGAKKNRIHTTTTGIIYTKIPIKLYEEYLKDDAFMVINRSSFINLRKVVSCVGEKITFVNGSTMNTGSIVKTNEVRLALKRLHSISANPYL